MRKSILIFTMMALLAVPVLAVTLTIDGNVVYVNGAQGEVLEVVSLTGRQVAQYRIDSASQRVELNLAKGCYVLKVGKVVRKVSIR